MSRRFATRLLCLMALTVSAAIAGRSADAARIEAVSGKRYTLTKAHGPWMIMVASFHTTGDEDAPVEGKTPQQAADELVLELRKKGIPAYTYSIEGQLDRFRTKDRFGAPVEGVTRRQTSLGVIAGNYESFESELAQKSLEWVKNYHPKCLQEGVSYRPTPGRPLPLSGAFLTINPLLSPEEVAERTPDPLLRRLNSGVRYSLAENPGEYTLMVAHFGGKTFAEAKEKRSITEFLIDNDLDDAGRQAGTLAAALREDLIAGLTDLERQTLDQSMLQRMRNFKNTEAYVWHDRSHSVVTVGSFSSPNDPAIAHLKRLFGAQLNPQTGQVDVQYIALPGAAWAFVPTPQVMKVPKLR